MSLIFYDKEKLFCAKMIFHKVWTKVIKVGESESAASFSKFSIGKISLKKTYLRERTIVNKLWPKVTGVGEFQCVITFSKFSIGNILLKEGYLRERIILYFLKISLCFVLYSCYFNPSSRLFQKCHTPIGQNVAKWKHPA